MFQALKEHHLSNHVRGKSDNPWFFQFTTTLMLFKLNEFFTCQKLPQPQFSANQTDCDPSRAKPHWPNPLQARARPHSWRYTSSIYKYHPRDASLPTLRGSMISALPVILINALDVVMASQKCLRDLRYGESCDSCPWSSRWPVSLKGKYATWNHVSALKQSASTQRSKDEKTLIHMSKPLSIMKTLREKGDGSSVVGCAQCAAVPVALSRGAWTS